VLKFSSFYHLQTICDLCLLLYIVLLSTLSVISHPLYHLLLNFYSYLVSSVASCCCFHRYIKQEIHTSTGTAQCLFPVIIPFVDWLVYCVVRSIIYRHGDVIIISQTWCCLWNRQEWWCCCWLYVTKFIDSCTAIDITGDIVLFSFHLYLLKCSYEHLIIVNLIFFFYVDC